MSIDALGGGPSDSAAAKAAADAAAAKTKGSGSADLDKDAFLKLLVAQLKYQNPLSPMDGKEFLAQSAQFAVVEKLEAMAKAQSDLGNWQKAIAGEGMVGKQVTSTNATAGTSVTGVVTGMTLTPSGPRLVLAGGGTMAVDDVDEVSAPGTTPTTPTTPASKESGTGSSSQTASA